MPLRAEAGSAESLVERALLALPADRYLLAVSGGRDSMALLDAFTRWRPDAVAVATFDHGTGRAAVVAAELVEAQASARGVPVVTGRLDAVPAAATSAAATPAGATPAASAPTEATWRQARWRFLNGWARELKARVVTAHTRDDQAETVFIRVLRGAGPRGLAGMYAPSAVVRPLLDVPRSVVAAYAAARRLAIADDPSNLSRAHLRNRVRLDLLPAIERLRPGFGDGLLALGRDAASWRAGVEAIVDRLGVTRADGGAVIVPARALESLPVADLATLWPAIAGRAGVALDWRGTERLAAFTKEARPGRQVPLSGGAFVRRTATSFVLATASRVDPTILR